ncbi:MAG: DNA polymerase I [Phototrophicaceae bacterium]
MADRPTLYLIDGHAVAYRQFFALPEAAFSTKTGEVTNAVFGFTRILIDILQDKRPKYLAVTFDAGLSGRDEYFEDYKATREKMPDSLGQQLKRIHEVVDAFNIPILKLEGYEADDVIGTISRQAEAQDVDVLIITGDRDILQLLTSHVQVQLPAFKSRPDVVYDIPKFVDKYQIQPNQLVDLKAMMGDSSDNIPGIKGIGEKTGTKLLLQYHTLDGIYENVELIKGSVHKKLVAGKDIAYVSQRLATIMCDLPIELDLESCVSQDFDFNVVSPLFRELEFRSLFDRLESYNMNQLPLFNMNAEDDGSFGPDEVADNVVIVNTKDSLDALVEALNTAEHIVWDVETTGIDQMSAELVGIALAVDESTGYYVPVGHKNSLGEQIGLGFVLDALSAPLTNPDIPKYAHNAVYDLVVMQRYGIDVAPIGFDSMLAEWVRDPISKFLGLKNFARQELGIHMTDIEELIGKGKNQKTMADVAIDHAAKYAAADAVVTLKAVKYLQAELDKEDYSSSKEVYQDIDIPMIPIIADMQRKGVVVDVAFLNDMSERLALLIADLEKDIYDLSGQGEFNINSPKQLSEILFDEDKLNLPKEGLNKTTHGYSTAQATLDILKNDHPIIEKISEYRELSKLKSTYVDALPELVNPKTGRVHTSYNQTGTSTGRFSSSNPNLQNIPIRTELGREVRRAFVAPDGYKLLAVDYSQIELRIMAHISEDKTLMSAFEEGQDIHQATAAAVFDIEPDEVTYDQRSFAKRVNFGLMYGMGPYRLARESNLTLGEAQSFVDTYFKRIPGVKQYIDVTEKQAQDEGYVETLLGRKRYFRHLQDGKTSGNRVRGELRAAINMPIQGTAADILKIAMIDLHKKLKESDLGASMILQVHDELVLEVPDETLEETTRLVIETMQNAYQLNVPVVANADVGQNWRDMESVD